MILVYRIFPVILRFCKVAREIFIIFRIALLRSQSIDSFSSGVGTGILARDFDVLDHQNSKISDLSMCTILNI